MNILIYFRRLDNDELIRNIFEKKRESIQVVGMEMNEIQLLLSITILHQLYSRHSSAEDIGTAGIDLAAKLNAKNSKLNESTAAPSMFNFVTRDHFTTLFESVEFSKEICYHYYSMFNR